jgi:hypothetical protein
LVAALALAGCGEAESGGGKFASALRSVSGNIGKLKGNKVKICAIVGAGANQQRIPAVVDAAAGKFSFNDLPAGPKTLAVEQDGQVRTVAFPLNEQENAPSAEVIPETRLASDTFDLGDVEIDEGSGRVVVQNNPFAELVDTDADGLFDFFDDDIDGDGLFNWDDDIFFGEEWEEYADWAWSDEEIFLDEWDCDQNGIPDWEQYDIDWSAVGCDYNSEWEDYWEDEDVWDEYDDSYWEDEGEFCDPSVDLYCDEYGDEYGDEFGDEYGDEFGDEYGDEYDDGYCDEYEDEDCFDGNYYGDESDGDEDSF